ncbi:UNVERIFIED_CONTAM: hypothetical protein Slati_2151500 [Sesamum latifolium]|uniref:Exosporium leader peptide n=1 Tax=Sesamum latifolium TaxID=2727402 RepID=A0AAW2WS92_9LAMI
MANPNNGGDHESYEGVSSLPTASGPIVPPVDPTLGDTNFPSPNPTLGANAPIPILALEQTAETAV